VSESTQPMVLDFGAANNLPTCIQRPRRDL